MDNLIILSVTNTILMFVHLNDSLDLIIIRVRIFTSRTQSNYIQLTNSQLKIAIPPTSTELTTLLISKCNNL